MLTLGSPQNPPLVFLHGFLGSRFSWREVAESLSGEYFCLLPDLPGHGENLWNLDAPLDFEILNDWLLRLLNNFSAPKIHLAGYSLGGRAALNFACRYPEKILSLTLESASPGLVSGDERARRLEQDSARAAEILREGLPAFLEKWYAMPLFASLQARPALLNALKQSAAQNDARQMAKVIRALSPGLQAPLWEFLPGLNFPLLLLAGEKDEKYARLTAQMAARLPAARLEIVAGAGHNLHAEKPKVVAKCLRSIISS
ncbi:MAG: 2-succinyl-6-hydroxy-2,4-cyclohexadiene-1-carboxy late synthase [Anaerolineales bacterium]